jgi:hypothetical protein
VNAAFISSNLFLQAVDPSHKRSFTLVSLVRRTGRVSASGGALFFEHAELLPCDLVLAFAVYFHDDTSTIPFGFKNRSVAKNLSTIKANSAGPTKSI